MAESTETEMSLAAQAAMKPIHKAGNREIAIVPKGYDVVDLERYLNNPVRHRAHHRLHDVDSFIMYCQDFDFSGTDASRLFGNKNNTTFTAVFDYSEWSDHIAEYACPLSDEWMRWFGQSTKQTTQHQFAQFIEDNLPDISKPVGADMLEISRSLEAKKNVNFLSTTRLRDGTVDFLFEEKIEATAQKGKLHIPEIFEILIPVFSGGDIVFISARLRYRLESGKLFIWYELVRPHKVLEEAFQKVRKQIENGLNVKALMGEI